MEIGMVGCGSKGHDHAQASSTIPGVGCQRDWPRNDANLPMVHLPWVYGP
jgi:hypothetical protein